MPSSGEGCAVSGAVVLSELLSEVLSVLVPGLLEYDGDCSEMDPLPPPEPPPPQDASSTAAHAAVRVVMQNLLNVDACN